MSVLSAVLAQVGGSEVTLTAGGAVMMTICVGLVLGLNIFCLTRILRPVRPTEQDP